MVTLDFTIIQYGHSTATPTTDLHAYQDLDIFVPMPVYASGCCYCNYLISLNIL